MNENRRCPECRALKPRAPLSNEEFKATFKAGDTVEGYSSNLLFTITAIGEHRMLIKQWTQNGADTEQPSMIVHHQARWRKPGQ